MKAIPVENEASIAVAKAYAAVSDIRCCWIPNTPIVPGVGATGLTHDWSVSRRIVETAGIPVIMAGGADPRERRGGHAGDPTLGSGQ